MLIHLYIKNYTLISEADIDFHPGFSVITGETGSGKSILMGALGLLIGRRADMQVIKSDERKCVVEGTFVTKQHAVRQLLASQDIAMEDDNTCLLRRELSVGGKSRCFINDTPVTLNVLKDIGILLIDIHSQHQNLLLGSPSFLKDTLDAYAHQTPLRKQYETEFDNYAHLSSLYAKKQADFEKQAQELDFLKFQYAQLDEAHLENGEQERVEEELNILNHAEELKTRFYVTCGLLEGRDDAEGVLTLLRQAGHNMQSVAEYNPQAQDLAMRIENCRIELKDILEELQALDDGLVFDASRLEQLNERLNTLYSLQKKFRVNSVKELIAVRDNLQLQIEQLDNSDSYLTELQKKKDEVYARVISKGEQLRSGRKGAASEIEKKLCSCLQDLGLPNAVVSLELSPMSEPAPTGLDEISFMFSSNKSLPMQPAVKIASGGEISRLMLAFKYILSDRLQLSTVVFDEIDTGVSGKMADKMAQVMQEIARNGQVISITHLPQVAALGKHHYKVEKSDNESGVSSCIRELARGERIDEIAHMLSGTTLTQAARDNAQDLLNKNEL